jgi:hypothetical protein
VQYNFFLTIFFQNIAGVDVAATVSVSVATLADTVVVVVDAVGVDVTFTDTRSLKKSSIQFLFNMGT